MRTRYPKKENVLLVNITRLGDMLQATPTIAGIKMDNPNCKTTVIVEKQFEEVCQSIPYIDEVVSVDLGMTVRCIAREGEGIIDAYEYVDQLVKDLKRRNFDYCLNMSSSAYTALLIRLIGITRNGGWTADEEGYRVIESDWAKLFASSVFPHNRPYNSLNLVDMFRCSADVVQHPQQLLIDVNAQQLAHADELLGEAAFTNTGPLIAVQAGASQEKRRWSPAKFIKMINILIHEYNARVVLTGTQKELAIVDPIKLGVNNQNVFVAAGKTTVPQLSALLKRCDVLVTGDTGPMHISVAVGTPVVAMFLASAYAFETGPYAEGSLILQPVISCGPCNPNKPCAKPDCHDHIEEHLIAELAALRAKGDLRELPVALAENRSSMIYRSTFDEHGFYDLQPLNTGLRDPFERYRRAYRHTWLEDLGDLKSQAVPQKGSNALGVVSDELAGIDEMVSLANEGISNITKLIQLIGDASSPARALAEINQRLPELDRTIEQKGFQYGHLGPIARMFVFGKENLCGSEAVSLASQMKDVYEALARRSQRFAESYCSL